MGGLDWVRYIPEVNQVVTTLLCATEDPQRRACWPPIGTVLDPLIASVHGATTVVLHDTPLDPPPTHPAHLELVAAGGNPYHHRWAAIAGWLDDVRPTGWVWCVDGSDVEMLHEPWTHMETGVLYAGSEPCTWSNPWLVGCHPSIRPDAGDQPLLNAGLLGGDAATVAEFVAAVVGDLAGCGEDRTDMAAFNRCASRFHVVTGERVHTEFRANDHDHPTAWWRHK